MSDLATAGWVKLHRRTIDSAVFQDAELLKLWIWLLLKTNFKRTYISMPTGRANTLVTIEPGQCVIGRKLGAKELGWKESTFSDRLLKLENMGMIKRHPGAHWTVVTIVNWRTYLQLGSADPTGNQQANSSHPTGDQHIVRTNKKDKKNERDPKGSTVPSMDEVKDYAATLDPTEFPNAPSRVSDFHDYYTANGWTLGQHANSIQNWQAVFRSWVRKQKNYHVSGPATADEPRTYPQPKRRRVLQ